MRMADIYAWISSIKPGPAAKNLPCEGIEEIGL
jgi:hypothetical protein